MNLSAIGVDLALVRNSSAFVAARPEGNVIVIREALELRPTPGQPLKLSEVMPKACDFAHRHGAERMFGDHHMLSEARQHLRPGYYLDPVDGGGLARMRRFVVVRGLLTEGRVRIPGQYTKLKQQLRDAVAKPSPGGLVNVVLKSRGQAHSDLVAAFVIAVSQAVDPSFSGIPRSFWEDGKAFARAVTASLSSFDMGLMTSSSYRARDLADDLRSYGAHDQFAGCQKTVLHDASPPPPIGGIGGIGGTPYDF